MKGPQSGLIRVGEATRAFFVPGTEFWESQHINAVVNFHLGFAYAGLRAWRVSLGRGDVAKGMPVAGLRQANQSVQATSVGGAHAGSRRLEKGVTAQREEVVAFISDLLRAAEDRNRPLYVSVVGDKLLGRFPDLELGEKRGYASALKFVRNLDAFVVSGSGIAATVQLRPRPPRRHPADVSRMPDRPVDGMRMTPGVSSARKAGSVDSLKADVAEFVRQCVLAMEKAGRPLFASELGNRLSHEFPGLPIQKRFGYERLTDLLATLEGITLRGEGTRTTVNLK